MVKGLYYSHWTKLLLTHDHSAEQLDLKHHDMTWSIRNPILATQTSWNTSFWHGDDRCRIMNRLVTYSQPMFFCVLRMVLLTFVIFFCVTVEVGWWIRVEVNSVWNSFDRILGCQGRGCFNWNLQCILSFGPRSLSRVWQQICPSAELGRWNWHPLFWLTIWSVSWGCWWLKLVVRP